MGDCSVSPQTDLGNPSHETDSDTEGAHPGILSTLTNPPDISLGYVLREWAPEEAAGLCSLCFHTVASHLPVTVLFYSWSGLQETKGI